LDMSPFFKGKSIEELIQDLGNERQRDQALRKLSEKGATAIPYLIAILGDEDRQACATALLRDIGEPAIPALLGALDDTGRQTYASVALYEINKPGSVIPYLVVALGDKKKAATVCNLLKQFGMPALEPAIPALVEALGDRDRQEYATLVLQGIGSPAIAPLLKATSDQTKRKWAIFTLMKIDKRTVTDQMMRETTAETPNQAEKSPPPSTTSSSQSKPRFCAYCGAAVTPAVVFCPRCGNRLP